MNGQLVIDQARAACTTCPFYSGCVVAPLLAQTAGGPGERAPHPHRPVLRDHLRRLTTLVPRYERVLLQALAGPDEGRALIAGCLFAEAVWDEPSRLCRLLEGIAARGPQARELGPFEERVIRAAAFLQDPAVPPLLRGTYQLHRGERDVSDYEAVRLATRLIGGEMPAVWFNEAVREEDRSGFEASFALREKPSPDGSGALDLFFTTRSADSRSHLFYYRRDKAGKQAMVPLESVRPDSLLMRLFKVFDTDQMKTHRVFAKIARFLNNGFKGLDKRMLWEGLKRLGREQQIVLALYAPRLGKYIEKRARFPGLYRLSKFLHRNVSDKRGQRPSHQLIFEQRAMVHDIVEFYGKPTFKEFCTYVFRIAEATPEGPQWSDLIFKIGEVAYFLTAVEGFNPAGLELSLRGRNPLAFLAYGLQPPARAPGWGLARLGGAGPRLAETIDPGARKDALLAACDQGLDYMAKIHGHESVPAFEQAAQSSGPPPPPEPAPSPQLVRSPFKKASRS